MDASKNNALPPESLQSSNEGRDFVGLALWAVPSAMNIFGHKLLSDIVTNGLKKEGVRFTCGGTYDQNIATLILQVGDWKLAASILHSTLGELKLLPASSIYRMDFSEGVWRRLSGQMIGDFQAIMDGIDPKFAASELVKLKSMQSLIERGSASVQEKGASEL